MLLIDIYKIPITWSLLVTVTVLVATMVLSLKMPPRAGQGGGAYPFPSRKREDTGH
jgi:tellurite resistance protein TerC